MSGEITRRKGNAEKMRKRNCHTLRNRLLAGVIVLSMLPAFAVAASAAAEERTISVKVTATEKGTGKVVPVNGAWVSVYSGQGMKGQDVKYIGSFQTKKTSAGDGYAQCKITIPGDIAKDENKVNEYVSKLTFSASKVVASGSGIGR